MSRKVSAYSYVIRGIEYDMPFKEMVLSALPVVDEFHIVTDDRFTDGTYSALRALEKEHSKVCIHNVVLDLNDPGIDGKTKAYARRQCQGDILLQLDSDEVLREVDYPRIKKLISDWDDSWLIVSAGVINWFNGEHFKLSSAGWIKERFSKNTPKLTHGIPDDCKIPTDNPKYFIAIDGMTDGAGYIDDKGNGVGGNHFVCNPRNMIDDIKQSQKGKNDHIWVHHYSWYSLPRKWEMKQTWHYMWGLLYGKYKNLDDYKVDLDGNKVNFWGKPIRPPGYIYIQPIKDEMKEPTIVDAGWCKHPPVMNEWIKRQRVYIPKNIKRLKFREEVRNLGN